jgi:hypothetical protein
MNKVMKYVPSLQYDSSILFIMLKLLWQAGAVQTIPL